MTWTAASPGFPAAFSLRARGGGAAAPPASAAAQSSASSSSSPAAREEGARAGRPVEAFGERGQPCPPREGAAWAGGWQVLPVSPAEDARGRRAAGRAGPGKAPAPAAGAPRLPRPPEAQPEGSSAAARRAKRRLSGLLWSPRADGAEGARLCAAPAGSRAPAPPRGAEPPPPRPGPGLPGASANGRFPPVLPIAGRQAGERSSEIGS